ncbi:MAG: hypothetical protein LBB90_12320 [Tannerella sp.]|nr:hypothetical protein [Tannerella sp.]
MTDVPVNPKGGEVCDACSVQCQQYGDTFFGIGFNRFNPEMVSVIQIVEKMKGDGDSNIRRHPGGANGKDFAGYGAATVLITNLYDRASISKDDLKEVYHLCWGIETCYGYLKEELQTGQFSGIRQICIEQDFAATLLLFNLQSLIGKQTEPYVEAVSRKRKYRYKVSKNISRAWLKNRVVCLFICRESHRIPRSLADIWNR